MQKRRSFIHIIVSLLCLITVTAFIFTMWKAKSILTSQPGLLYVRLVTMSKNTMMP